MDWYPWFPLDFRRDTYHLSLAEDGAYRRLLDEYMLLGGPIPDDDIAIARMIGIGLDEWLVIASKVRSFFKVRGGRLTHKRCDQELAAQARRKARYSERGQKAAFARYSKINKMPARAVHVHATRHNNNKTTATVSVAESEGSGEQDEPCNRPGLKASSELAELLKAKGYVRDD